MATQRGIAVIFGFPGQVSVAGTALAMFNESIDVEDEFQLDEVRDEINDVRTLIGSGQVYRVSMRFTPRAVSPNTIAQARLALAPPAMLSLVTFTSVDNALLTTAYGSPTPSVNWVYIGGWRQSASRNGIATYELRAMRSVAYDISATVT